MAITSPITNFTTTFDDGDANQYFSGKDAGFRCAWAMIWLTGESTSATMRNYEVYHPRDWITVEAMDTTLLDYELTDVANRDDPGQEPDAGKATKLLTAGNDVSKRTFLTQARDRYKTAVYFPNPPPRRWVFVQTNPTGWDPTDYSTTWAATVGKPFWDKFKAIQN